MAEATRFPLSWPAGWPRIAASARKASQFRTGYVAALKNLNSQLALLGATAILISTNSPLRKDGNPYADVMADDIADPGVAVYFSLKGEPRVMARDGHPTPAENLHAIGHVIEALRSIERHGGSYMMARAFSAFEALPAPGSAKPWRAVLGFAAFDGVTLADIEARYRKIAKTRHPDAPGGSHEAMAELNQAHDMARREMEGVGK